MADWIHESEATKAAIELTANKLTGSFESRIDYSMDRDWIRIELLAGVPYQFFAHMTGIGARDEDVQIRLANANGSLVPTTTAVGFNGDYFTFTPATAGTYYLVVNQASASAIGEYSAFVARASMSVAPPLDEFDNVVADSDAVTGGDDTLVGGAGSDRLTLTGADRNLIGEQGDDELAGNAANNFISGGLGHDRIVSFDGNDNLSGDGGDDYIQGGSGADQVLGGPGFDTLLAAATTTGCLAAPMTT